MKKYIAKVKQRGEKYTHRVVVILASVSTLAVVAIWLLLTSLIPQEETAIQIQDTTPNIEEFFQETRSQVNTISESLNEAPTFFNQEQIQELEEEVITETNE